jgi:hypothetical protein
MHPSAFHERLAFDPAQDLSALFVQPEPAGGCAEAGALEVEKDVAGEPRVRPRWAVHGVPDADDAVVRRAAGQRLLRVSRG